MKDPLYNNIKFIPDLFSRHDSTCHPGSCYFVFRVKDTWEGAKVMHFHIFFSYFIGP